MFSENYRVYFLNSIEIFNYLAGWVHKFDRKNFYGRFIEFIGEISRFKITKKLILTEN